MKIIIKKDQSLKLAYGSLLILFLIITLILYLIGVDIYLNFLIGSGLLFLLLLTQFDSRPILVIDETGFTKKGKSQVKWREIEQLKFERVRAGKGSFLNFEIKKGRKSKPIEVSLKRTTIIPKELYLALVDYTNQLGLDIDVRGLEKWNAN